MIVLAAVAGLTIAHPAIGTDTTNEVQQDQEVRVTVENASADRIVLENASLSNVTVPAEAASDRPSDTNVQQALQRAFAGANVGSMTVDGVTVDSVTVDQEAGTARVDGTVDRVVVEDASLARATFTTTRGQVEQMSDRELIQGILEEQGITAGSVSTENLQIDIVSVDSEAAAPEDGDAAEPTNETPAGQNQTFRVTVGSTSMDRMVAENVTMSNVTVPAEALNQPSMIAERELQRAFAGANVGAVTVDGVTVDSVTIDQETGMARVDGTVDRVVVEDASMDRATFLVTSGQVGQMSDSEMIQRILDEQGVTVGSVSTENLRIDTVSVDSEATGVGAGDGDRDTADRTDLTFSGRTVEEGTVVVDSATLSEGGFVAIHDGGRAGPIIGVSEYLDPGTHENVEIQLDEEPSIGARLVAMAHRDTDGNQQFEFAETGGSEDLPYVIGNQLVTDSATLAGEDGTPTETATPTDTETPTETETLTEEDGVGDEETETPTEEDVTGAEETETPTEEDVTGAEGTETPTETETPGFGVVVALLALTIYAILRRR